VAPDEGTQRVARTEAERLHVRNFRNIQDPGKGKPAALRLALAEVKGQIIFLTDGDVYLGEGALGRMMQSFTDEKVGGVTGRPVSVDERTSFMGYIGHMLADAAHHKRMVTMRPESVGKSLSLVSREPHFFVLSGYIIAMRNLKIMPPADCLIEDAYFSYELHNRGYKLVYEPEALVHVKYARTVRDWYKQKLRSVGGYVQLWKYGVIKPSTRVRNFWKELEYFWFPLKYARNVREFLWSLLLYPMRLWLWLQIYWQQRVQKKRLDEVWVRIESTK
jgi:cellulose synthase/poly-beta-1,6-N-acetylglucosamine synthase-like glycosyltransferase